MAAAATESPQVNGVDGDGSQKIPSSITRVYNVPVVKDGINYADNLLKSYSLSAAAYNTAGNIAATVYKQAGEPLQDRLEPQIKQLDGIANRGLDYVQNKAPFIFETKSEEIVATARKPADQAYATAKSYQDHAYSTAKSYQDMVSTRLHDTLVASRDTFGSLNARLGAAAAHVPKSGEEAQQAAHHLYEQLESIRSALLKQSSELPAHVSKALQPYIEKLQKGATDVKTELSKKDVPIHLKAQHIIGITKEVTSESLHEAIETLKLVVSKSNTSTKIQSNGDHAVESTEQFIQEHTPGNHSYAEAVKQ